MIFRRGQAIIIVLMIALVMGILAGAVMNFQRGQVHLLSKGAKDFLALCVAEAGIHAVLAEMRANYQFVTHGNPYVPSKDWSSPASHRPFLLAETSGLELDYNGRGTYSGRVTMKQTRNVGEFRVRVKLAPAKNSVDTKTVDETHRYFIIEAVGRVGDSYRKISGVIERHVPGSYLLYDGQILDTGGYGPYRTTPGTLRAGRLYGHDMIQISRRGNFDVGTDYLDIEKLSTPGTLKVLHSTHITFRNNQQGRLKPGNDSSNPEKFKSFPEKHGQRILGHFVLDGNHGGKSEKFPPLNPDYYLSATRPRPEILTADSDYEGFSESKWRNPAKPEEVVYDLNFGWKYRNRDDKVLLYSKVPLRIWGCPPSKATTIFSEKDVYIAGDFNHHPDNPQNYDLGYRDYTNSPRNGIDKNGVVVLSMGRIWFDYSNPMLFLRNEMRAVLDYEIAMALGGEELKPSTLGPIIFPPRANTRSRDPRLPMTTLHFPALSSLASLPKEPPEVIPVTVAGLLAHPAMNKLKELFAPSSNPEEYKNRFVVRSFTRRNTALAKFAATGYMLGILTPGARDSLIDTMMDQAEKEVMDGEPDPSLGAWNIFPRVFKMAATYPKTGFMMPEMTVNALLIDSAELNAKWAAADGADKVLNEIGNVKHAASRSFPYATSSHRMILRHYGGKMHLRTAPVQPYLDGSARDDSFIVRRNLFDNTYARGGGDYYPPYQPAAFTLSQFSDSASNADEFNSF